MIAACLSGLARMAHKVGCPDGSHLMASGTASRPARNRAFAYALIMIGARPPEVVIMRRLFIASPSLTDDAESAIWFPTKR